MAIETVSIGARRGGGLPPAQLRELIGRELDRRRPRAVARDSLVLIAETALRTDPRLDPDHVTGEAGLQAAVREAVEEVRGRHPTLFEDGASAAARPSPPPVIEGQALEGRASPGPARAAGPADDRHAAPLPPRGPELEARRSRIRPSHLLYGGVTAALLLAAGFVLAPSPSGDAAGARSVGRMPEERAAQAPAPAARREAALRDPETTGSIGRNEEVVFPEQREALKGVADVVDTATLKVNGKVIRLFGVEWAKGARGEELARYLKRREVECEPTAAASQYRCTVDRYDLSEVVLYNGGGRATADASPDLKAAESHARENRFGVWKGR